MRRTRPVAIAIACSFAAAAPAQPPQWPLERAGGPDTIVGQLFDARVYPAQTREGETWRPLALGTDVWNIGDRPVEWDNSTNQHAVIVQNVYRATAGRFDQIGLSWAKHVVVAANLPADPSYGPCIPPGGFARLGVNCADLYSSQQNGAQPALGPRFDINPATGSFTIPYSPLSPPAQTGDGLARRLSARETDLDPALNPGAIYYAEAAVYSPDDAGWSNGRNNVSTRLLGPVPLDTAEQAFGFAGPSYRTTALEYWAWATPGVGVTSAEIHERDATVSDRWDPYSPGDTSTPMLPQSQWATLLKHLRTRFVAAAAVADNGDGTWTYTYPVMNVNSHRAGESFSLRLPRGAQPLATGFHAPQYHSGDRVRNAPWVATVSQGRLVWRMDPASEQATLPGVGSVVLEPNALRFATVYTFSVRVNAPPTTGWAVLGLWRPPADTAGYQGGTIALPGLPVPGWCTADVGGPGGTPAPDGLLDNNDFIAFITAFFNVDNATADLGSAGGAPDPNNVLDNNDFIAFINAFFAGCG